jgi:uncharacterized membrane protein YhiD involved in acid resistance
MQEINGLNFAVSSSIDLISFIVTMIGAAFISFLVSHHYHRCFPHISRSQSMGKTLIVISLVTFLIISVVKSSLALSLGLVGALSIIRFRTPIKEPFELAYLFMAIAIGLGFGAQQIAPTVILILFVLAILSVFQSKLIKAEDSSFFIYINIDEKLSSEDIQERMSQLDRSDLAPLKLKRMDQVATGTQFTLVAKISDDEILSLNTALNEAFSPKSITIVDGQKLMPF